MNRRTFLGSGVAWLAACRLGGEATVPPPSTPRLVSLTPAITETLGALGALDLVVGRSDWCDHPPEVAALPAVGSALTPNLEAIAGLQPSAILVDASNANQTDDLRAVARVEVLPWLTVSEVTAHHVDEGWQVVSTAPQTLDLLALQGGVVADL